MSIDPHSIGPQSVDDAQITEALSEHLSDLTSAEIEKSLAQARPAPPRPTARGRIRGEILSIRGADVFVQIGGKTEGVVSIDEFEPDQPPQIGQTMELIPHGFDRESGLMRLSLREAIAQADLESLKVGDVVKARVTGSNIGGLELRIHGIRGFMPLSQVDVVRHDDVRSFIGHWVECEVVEIDRRGKNVLLSRRRVLERERAEQREQLKYQLAEGQVRQGKVSRLADFGAFVDLGGIDGLLHVSDMSYARVNKPSDLLQLGQEIEVKILKIDLVKDRISLGMKQLQPDPWLLVATNYRAGDAVDGKVTRLEPFGAFVEIEAGVEALIPISEMSWTQRVTHPSKILSVGDSVRCGVLSVDPEKRKISLSLKSLTTDPWQTVVEKYTPESTVSGLVTRITDFGAFVQLEEGIEGLVHISQLSDRHIKRVNEVVKGGEVVQVRILKVDPAERRISLSMKSQAPATEAAPEAADAAPAEPPKKSKERKRPLRGGLTW